MKKWLLGAGAFIACPCHLPLLAVLLAGTAGGAWLSRYQGVLLGVMTAAFVGFGYLFLRHVWQSPESGHREERQD
ncbi:MAG: hypothetical protein HY680_06245 [Chloroflexi bacterium]|nr:hypothetical protein [Chloroflexota bacterium]